MILIALAGGLFSMWITLKKPKTIVKKDDDFSSSPTPLPRVVPLKAVDAQMVGIIELGSDLYWISGYYDSHPLQNGDLVYYRYETGQTPVVRVVRGIPGDRFEVVKSETEPGWKVKVNDSFLKIGKEDLIFGSPAFVPPLGLAAKSHGNRIGEGEAILMTNSRSGRFDSTLMGLVSTRDIVGKIVLSEAETQGR